MFNDVERSSKVWHTLNPYRSLLILMDDTADCTCVRVLVFEYRCSRIFKYVRMKPFAFVVFPLHVERDV